MDAVEERKHGQMAMLCGYFGAVRLRWGHSRREPGSWGSRLT
jgi:hypothetical protein